MTVPAAGYAVHGCGASAPGKLVLCGEYAVLWGAPGVVTAVQRRAVARLSPPGRVGSPPLSAGSAVSPALPPEALVTRRLVESWTRTVEGELSLDVSALRADEGKLGLGSSAATAAAVAGAVLAGQGMNLAHEADRVFRAALLGHRSVAPHGSGIDVAASVHGGTLRYSLSESAAESGAAADLATASQDLRAVESSAPTVDALLWPADLEARVVWSGTSARTSDLLAAVGRLAREQPAAHRAVQGELMHGATDFAAAFAAADVPAVIESASRYGQAMDRLGHAAAAPVVTAPLRHIAHLAAAQGGAAKPSGAGGGDVAVGFFPGLQAAAAFEAACASSGFLVVFAPLGGPGVLPLAPERHLS